MQCTCALAVTVLNIEIIKFVNIHFSETSHLRQVICLIKQAAKLCRGIALLLVLIADFEPLCVSKFDDSYEANLYSVSQVKGL